jgi:hypothetical protein
LTPCFDTRLNSPLRQSQSGNSLNSAYTYRIVKISLIQDVVVMGDKAAETELKSKLACVNLKKIEEREKSSLRAARQKASKIGVGVTVDAQGIFDALNKT